MNKYVHETKKLIQPHSDQMCMPKIAKTKNRNKIATHIKPIGLQKC